MTQNMFQEGLYQVFWGQPSPRPLTAAANQEGLKDARIYRWFGTIVNTRLLITGVLQILCAAAGIVNTVSYACLRYSCSVSMTTPVFSSLSYLVTGGLAIEVQRKPNRPKVTTLMVLNVFSLLSALGTLLAYSLNSTQPTELNTSQQLAGAYVVKGSSILFTVQCLLASIYTLFLSWRGLRRYSGVPSQTYSRLPQGADNHAEPLLEQEEFSL